MSRIDNIKNYKVRTDVVKEEEQKRIADEREELVNKILQYSDRIKELIDTANACLENGIRITRERKWGGGKHELDFIADGVSHTIGFNHTRDSDKITDIRICAGGACGRLGFATNGNVVCSVSEDEDYSPFDKITKYEPRIEYMKKFINGFDAFEKRFYDYVDDVTSK